MGAREEGNYIRDRIVSLVTINDTATGGSNGLGWRCGIECAVEVLRWGSGAIKEVCKRKMRGVSGAAGSSGYLRLLLMLLMLLRRLRG